MMMMMMMIMKELAGIFVAKTFYWLVSNPSISAFEWQEGTTLLGSSYQFLILTILTYLTLTFLLYNLIPPKPTAQISPPPNSTAQIAPPALTPLRLISASHSVVLCVLSAVMAVGCTLATAATAPSAKWVFCFPSNQTPPRGPVFFWAYVFYLSKLLEFLDTLLILLAGDHRRLSFLHVYHHSVVVLMCYIWLHTSQSLLPIALVTNASVHVLMYAYYAMCALGKRPRWKRLVTDCQIVQFVFSFAVSIVMLYYHFSGEVGCSGFWGWVFNAGFNASLLALFTNFHTKNYVGGINLKKKD